MPVLRSATLTIDQISLKIAPNSLLLFLAYNLWLEYEKGTYQVAKTIKLLKRANKVHQFIA